MIVSERIPLVEIRTQLLSEICVSFIHAFYRESIYYPGLNVA